MFQFAPIDAPALALDKWKVLPRFDLYNYLSNKQINTPIDSDYEVQHVEDADSHGDYYGQIDLQLNKHGIGRS